MQTELLIGGVGASVLILILIEALKTAFLPVKYAPLVAIILGVAGGIAAAASTAASLLEGIALGVLSAGLASGLYSWQKSVRAESTPEKVSYDSPDGGTPA